MVESHHRWREGIAPAQIARKHKLPIGTTFGFTLNETAHVVMAFRRQLPGRQVRHRCVAPTKHSKHKPRCSRTIVAGTLPFTGHTGANTVRFDGRISRTRKLRPGTYLLIMTATSPTGKTATARLTFTIVKG